MSMFLPQHLLSANCVQPPLSATMAHVGEKRSREEDDCCDRRALGATVKKLRGIIGQSDATISATPVETWSKCLDKWDSNIEDIRACCLALNERLRGIPNMNAFEVDAFCRETAALTENLANRMQRSMSLLNDGVLDDTAREMQVFVDQHGGRADVPSETGKFLRCKMRWFMDSADSPPEFLDLLETQRPIVIEDTDDEREEGNYIQMFERARRAVEQHLELSTGTPFSVADAVKLANFFLGDIGRIKEKISAFQGPVDPNSPTSTGTKDQLEFVGAKLVAKDFLAFVPKAVCCSCLEPTQKWEACRCGAVLCADCFELRLEQQKSVGWSEPSVVSSLAQLNCDFCKSKTGGFSADLLRRLSPRGASLHREAVRADTRASVQQRALLDETRGMAHFRSLNSTESMLYFSVKQALVDLTTARTPCCRRPFGDFYGCASLECDLCSSSYFCALCHRGGWTRSECHLHVASCDHRPAEMDQAHFLPLNVWKKQQASRQHRLVAEWLRTRELPMAVKQRLANDFPEPTAEL